MKKSILLFVLVLLNSIYLFGQVVKCEGEFSGKNSIDIISFSDTILVGGDGCIYYSIGSSNVFDKKIDLRYGRVNKIVKIEDDIYVAIGSNVYYPTPSITVLNKNLQKKYDLVLEGIKGVLITEIVKCDSNLMIGTYENLSIYNLRTGINRSITMPYKDNYKSSRQYKHSYIGGIAHWNDSLIIAVNSTIYIADKQLKYYRLLFNSKSLKHNPEYAEVNYFIRTFAIIKDTLYACNETICFNLNLHSLEKKSFIPIGYPMKMIPDREGIVVATLNEGFYRIERNVVLPFNCNENIVRHGAISFIIQDNDIVFTDNHGIFTIENYSSKIKK